MNSNTSTGTAFAASQLSFDSVRELSRVATPDDEHLWLTVAAAASGAQLARICRACRRVLDLDTPKHADDQLRRRVYGHLVRHDHIHLRLVWKCFVQFQRVLVPGVPAVNAIFLLGRHDRSLREQLGKPDDAVPPADSNWCG